jgi:signal peptidase I
MRLGHIATGIATLAVVAAGWFFLAPTQLAGSTSYVQVYGVSMQPHFHAGDLVVVRAAGSYHVGEIVAYRNEQLGGHVVLHRIIGYANGRYTFKGDNNDFVDSYHPVRGDLVGRLWLHVPGAGRYLVWLRGRNLLFVGGAALLLALLGAGLRSERRPNLRRPETKPAFGPVATTAALLALVFAALAALSWTRPLTTLSTRSGLYTQSGTFGYDAVVPGGAGVYGTTKVTTGEPLFMQLVHSARFHFDYGFHSTAVHRVRGTVALDAVVSATNGWKHRIQIAAPQPFSGDHATASGVLAFQPLLALLHRVDTLSNVIGGTYTLTLVPRVQLDGAVAGTTLGEGFAPTVAFMLDPHQLQLQPAGATGPSAAASLTQTTSGSGTVETANDVRFSKLSVPVEPVRELSLIGGAAALLVLLGSLLLARRAQPGDEHEEIRRTYGDVIVDVAELPGNALSGAVQTSSFDGIARVAEQRGHVILHLERGGMHTYLVEDGVVRYAYSTAAAAPEARERGLRLAKEA